MSFCLQIVAPLRGVFTAAAFHADARAIAATNAQTNAAIREDVERLRAEVRTALTEMNSAIGQHAPPPVNGSEIRGIAALLNETFAPPLAGGAPVETFVRREAARTLSPPLPAPQPTQPSSRVTSPSPQEHIEPPLPPIVLPIPSPQPPASSSTLRPAPTDSISSEPRTLKRLRRGTTVDRKIVAPVLYGGERGEALLRARVREQVPTEVPTPEVPTPEAPTPEAPTPAKGTGSGKRIGGRGITSSSALITRRALEASFLVENAEGVEKPGSSAAGSTGLRVGRGRRKIKSKSDEEEAGVVEGVLYVSDTPEAMDTAQADEAARVNLDAARKSHAFVASRPPRRRAAAYAHLDDIPPTPTVETGDTRMGEAPRSWGGRDGPPTSRAAAKQGLPRAAPEATVPKPVSPKPRRTVAPAYRAQGGVPTWGIAKSESLPPNATNAALTAAEVRRAVLAPPPVSRPLVQGPRVVPQAKRPRISTAAIPGMPSIFSVLAAQAQDMVQRAVSIVPPTTTVLPQATTTTTEPMPPQAMPSSQPPPPPPPPLPTVLQLPQLHHSQGDVDNSPSVPLSQQPFEQNVDSSSLRRAAPHSLLQFVNWTDSSPTMIPDNIEGVGVAVVGRGTDVGNNAGEGSASGHGAARGGGSGGDGDPALAAIWSSPSRRYASQDFLHVQTALEEEVVNGDIGEEDGGGGRGGEELTP